MPYKDPEKSAEAMRNYRERKAAKDKAIGKQIDEFLASTFELQKKLAAGAASVDDVQAVGTQIGKMIAQRSHNALVFQAIDSLCKLAATVQEINKTGDPQAILDLGKRLKATISVDQIAVFNLGEDVERKRSAVQEYIKTNDFNKKTK